MAWINNLDNRRFLMQILFVIIVLLLLGYLHLINQNGQYDELIVGIIGMFLGVAGIASTDLISGNSKDEMKKLTQQLELYKKDFDKLKIDLEKERSEKNAYKNMIEAINEKLVKQSGLLAQTEKK